ncbi:MAG: YncE family protein [Mediterranea sp.]|jgi:hypothetical protein|nr:YncE family protein [Mediterranea sp.]
MKQKLTHIIIGGCLALLSALAACDDLEDKPVLIIDPPMALTDEGTAELYVLSEGLFNQNNSTLARYSFAKGQRTDNYFQLNNRRGLGDTANDLALYGSKLYIVVNVSSTVEVVDFATGQSLRQIKMADDEGRARQPRYITFYGDKAYVCSFDGTVARIDTTSMDIDGLVRVGRNPDGICVQNGKLYVSNSGGLDYNTAGGVDNTVSVVDIPTFRETKKITVGYNPGKIQSGIDNDVYVVSRGARIMEGDYRLQRIDCTTDAVVRTYDEPVLNFALDGPVAYIYTHNYNTKESAIKVLDLNAGTVLRDNFITDGTTISTPYAIQINPLSSNLYITDARNYTVWGDVYCFDLEGRLRFRLQKIGLNPNKLVFSDRASQGDGDATPEDPNAPTAFANRVLDYRPAPGQFINTATSAYEEGFSEAQVLARATEWVKKKWTLSLGAYGGSLTVGFSQPIRHVGGEYDFKVWGNASYNTGAATGRLGGSAEPGIVLVSKDANGNGLPDDPWYELAGSEYGKPTETRDYEITYYRPQPANADVRWTDNQGGEGYVYRNTYHTQSSYYPAWETAGQLTFRGTRLADNGIDENGTWVGYCYDWGYADNHPNSTDGSKFKIDWAVDDQGQPVQLDQIDFVRIYTAVNQSLGWTGESSTEVSTVEDLHFEKQ